MKNLELVYNPATQTFERGAMQPLEPSMMNGNGMGISIFRGKTNLVLNEETEWKRYERWVVQLAPTTPHPNTGKVHRQSAQSARDQWGWIDQSRPKPGSGADQFIKLIPELREYVYSQPVGSGGGSSVSSGGGSSVVTTQDAPQNDFRFDQLSENDITKIFNQATNSSGGNVFDFFTQTPAPAFTPPAAPESKFGVGKILLITAGVGVVGFLGYKAFKPKTTKPLSGPGKKKGSTKQKTSKKSGKKSSRSNSKSLITIE